MVPSRRRRIPIIRAQAVYTLEIWSLLVRDSLSTSPRCLWVQTCGMRTPLIETVGLCLVFFPIERCLLSGALNNSITHMSAEVAAAWRSALRVAQLDAVDLSAVCKLVSSAKMKRWLRVEWGMLRPFMKIRNNTGPRTVPWGIPDFGICHLDDAPFSWTQCSPRWRKLANHSRALYIKKRSERSAAMMDIQPYALLKSKKTDWTLAPSSKAMCRWWTKEPSCVTVEWFCWRPDWCWWRSEFRLSYSKILALKAASPLYAQHRMSEKLACSWMDLSGPSYLRFSLFIRNLP